MFNRHRLSAFLAGGIFGSGLMISKMVDTKKVQGWLDIFGDWDPTLAFVLTGAILPMVIAWRVAEARTRAMFGGPIPRKPEPRIDGQLVTGSLIFGAGWGLVGLCPGPALASLTFGGTSTLAFIVAMAAGMLLARPIKLRLAQAA